jgi:lysyl endopeptidase
MMRSRLAVLLLTSGSLLSLPALAIEVAAYTPDPSLLPARQPVEAPLRVAEALSLDTFSTLAPAREGAVSDLAALAAWNANPRNPTRVGFARALAQPLELRFDAARFAGRIGQRVGDGLVARRSTGNWVWGTSVEVAAAKALRLELAEVNLPSGALLWVYSLGGEARAFDLRRLRDDGTILSPTINGDRIYLEVELPAGGVADGQGLRIQRVHELVTPFGAEPGGARVPEADGCLQNGECFDSTDFPGITNARKGVFQYLFEDAGNLYTCSGALIGDNDPLTLQPWLLTAHHCVGSQASALSMDTYFFFRNANCGGGGTTGSYGPLGADLVVTSEDTDVTLARAVDSGDVPPGAVYLGWTSARPADGTILHRLSHPVRDLDDAILAQSYSKHQLDETPGFACSGVTTTNFLHSLNLDSTGISGGSSGSP